MKKGLIVSLLALGLTQQGAFAEEQAQTPSMSESDQISYSVGYQLGDNFKQQGQEFNTEMLFKGIQDSLSNAAPMLNAEERINAIANLKKQLAEKHRARVLEAKKVAEVNMVSSKQFLAANAKNPGVIKTPSGLQYKIIESGSGKVPTAEDKVTVNYTGKLINGTEFDSSYKRNQPTTFQVNQVIKGWQEAMQLMHVGDKWELYIPPDLGYGEHGAGDKIPPNSVLVFDVELLSVN